MQGPLDLAAKAQALEGGALNLQSQRMVMAAREAIGPIIQQSVDPQTGELNYNKAFVGLASNPATAWMANDILGQWTQRQLTQQETALKALETQQKKLEAGGNILATLLPKRDNLTLSDVTGALALAKAQGIIDDKEVQAYMNHFASKGEGAPLAAAVQQAVLGLSGSKNAIDQTFGTFAERAVPHEGMGPLGEKMFTTTGEQLGVQGPGQGGGGAAGAYGTPPASPLGGRSEGGPLDLPGAVLAGRGTPPAASNPLATPMARDAGGQAGAGSVPGSSPPSHVTSIPKPLENYYSDKGDVKEYEKKLADANTEGTQQLVMINDAEKAMKHFKQGPGMATRKMAAESLKAVGLNKVADALMGAGSADDPIANAQAFQKMMVISSMETLRKTLGGQGRITNLEFEKFEKALPSIETTPEATKKIFEYMKKLIALSREEQRALGFYVQGYKKNPYHPEGNFSLSEFQSQFLPYATKKGLVPKLELRKEGE